MGYCTYYTLEWKIPDGYEGKRRCDHAVMEGARFCPECAEPMETITPDVLIGDYIETRNDMLYCFDRDGKTQNNSSQFDTDSIREMSLQFPDVLFTLSGEGEEGGDLWKAYYLNGKMQREEGVITFGEFDPEKLV
jgi:hypothetical protein